MAFDLSKVDPKTGSTPDPSFRRETTEPRVSTDRPALEVNAQIRRPSQSGAEQLQKILGLVNDVGQEALARNQDHLDNKNAANAMLDFSSGAKNDQAFAKSRAYRDAWQLEGAKKLSVDIGDEVTKAVNERLNDSSNPATMEDIDHLIESIYQKHVIGSDGKVVDFGTVKAKTTIANSLSEIRGNLLPQAQAAIKKQMDATYLSTWANNSVHEAYRGAPIGEPRPVDPLAPLSGPSEAPPVTSTVYHGADNGKPLAPFQGFGTHITSRMGAPREGGSVHNGEDFAVPTGTQIVAPMQGTVVSSFSNARGGNQVRVKMADGAIVGFAHLSQRDVKPGDTVTSGQQLGLSGATGHATGPHVHMTVEVGGKKVSPTQYFSGAKVPHGLPSGPAYVATGDEPQLATAPPAEKVGLALAPFDFEAAMSRVPPGIDKGQAKSFLIQSLINEANSRKDVGLLQGLEDSKQKNGTPSLAPDQVATVQAAVEHITDKARIDADQQRKALFDANHDRILNAFLSNKPPAIGWLRAQAHAGLVDPDFAYAMENHVESEARQQASEARQETREANADANAGYDAEAAGEIALRSSGALNGVSAEQDYQDFLHGKFGQGKRAMMRFKQLRAAAQSGVQENLRNPEVALYAGQLHESFGKAPTNILVKSIQGGAPNYFGMIAAYRSKVGAGAKPEDAYLEVVQKFAPKSRDAVDARRKRIAELQAQRLGGGR